MTADQFARNRDNFCYRHPDRQSFTLCQRCLRTICPECQTQGAVGVICPECIRDQQRAASPAQKKAQKNAQSRWSLPKAAILGDRTTVVTNVTVAITVVVYLVQLIPGFGNLVEQFLLFWAPQLYPALRGTFQPWRLVTVVLVHSGFWHVGLNMLTLFMIGRTLEPMLGRSRYLTLYLFSAVGGSVAVALLSFLTPVVGASGAIFGLFGALLVIGRHLGVNITSIAVVIAINLVFGFLPGSGVSWQAHVGGLITGFVVGFIYTRTRAAAQRRRQIWLLVATGAVLVGLLFVPPVIYGFA